MHLPIFPLVMAVLFSIVIANKELTEDDIKAMTLSDLKKFLERKGVPCKDCIQKEDFVEMALSVKDQSDVEEKIETDPSLPTSDSYDSKTAEPENHGHSTPEHESKDKSGSSDWLKIYSDQVVKIASASFDKTLELYAEMVKIYGPRLRSYAKYGQEQFKKHGAKLLETTSKNLQYYGHVVASEGLKLTTKIIDLAIEFANKTVDSANEWLNGYRKAQQPPITE